MVVLDSAHGHSANVLHTVDMIKSKFPDLQVIAGNVATGAATEDLIKAGVDAVKVGIGPGSICTYYRRDRCSSDYSGDGLLRSSR